MNTFIQRFTQRKFLTMLIAQIAGLVVLFLPDKEDTIRAAAENIGALLLMGMGAFGYMQAEGKIDAARVEGEQATKVAAIESDKTSKQVTASVAATQSPPVPETPKG